MQKYIIFIIGCSFRIGFDDKAACFIPQIIFTAWQRHKLLSQNRIVIALIQRSPEDAAFIQQKLDSSLRNDADVINAFAQQKPIEPSQQRFDRLKKAISSNKNIEMTLLQDEYKFLKLTQKTDPRTFETGYISNTDLFNRYTFDVVENGDGTWIVKRLK